MKRKNSIYVYMILVSAVLLTKVLGLVRNMLLSQLYGTGIEASAFTAVSNLPLTIFDITLGTAISSAFIPVFNEKLSSEGEKKANRFASNFLNIVLTFSVIIVALGIIFPDIAVSLVASGFNSDVELMELACTLMRIIMPVMCFACCTFIFIGVLQSYGEFIAPSLVSLFSNLAMIIYLLFCNSKFGIYGLSVAFCFGWLLQAIFLVPFLKKKKFKYTFGFDLRSPDIKKVAILTLPLFVAALAQPINQLISTNLSSRISESGVSTVGYAYNAYFIVAGVFSYALTNMFFPEMSRKFAENDTDGATVICKDMLSTVSAIIMPIMAFLCAGAVPVIKIIYERGEFTSADTLNVSALLVIYSIGMIFLSWQDILNKYFYSMQKSVIPMVCASAGIVVNLVLSFILGSRYGLRGLAISTVVAGAVMMLGLCAFTLNVTKIIFKKDFIFELLKITVSGIAAYAVCRLVNNAFNLNVNLILQIICVIILFMVALAVYLVMLVLLRSNNLSKIISLFIKGGKSV